MAIPFNLYVAGNPVGDSSAFVGRVDVLRVLRRSQDNTIVFYGQRHKRGEGIMVRIKTVADTLTSIRFLLGPYLIWLGLRDGPKTVAAAALTLLVAWATDVLDGPLARRDPRGIQTWIGDHDLEADMTVALGVWVYLALARFLSFWLAIAYVVAAAAALWHFGSIHLGWGVQALPYGAMIWTAWRTVPPYGLLLVAWVGFVLVATWPRFPQQTLPEFLGGMRDLLRRH